MRKSSVYAIIVALLTFTVSGFADIVTGGSGWVSWTQSSLKENAVPGLGAGFWDHSSWDGAKCNIGWWLTSSGTDMSGCGSQASVGWVPPGALDFYAGAKSGVTNKDTPTNFTFNTTDPLRTVQLRLEVAGYRTTNKFGWYDVASEVKTEIFPGAASAIATWSGSITTGVEGFGYYIEVPNEGKVYKSGANGKQFALFSSEGAGSGGNLGLYWLGMEDKSGTSDWDYQDMVVKVQVISLDTNVPEPSAYVVLCIGLGCLVWLVRRRRQSA